MSIDVDNFIQGKMLDAADEYLYSVVRYQAWDSIETMHLIDHWLVAFNFTTSGTKYANTDVKDYIRRYLSHHIPIAIETVQQEGCECLESSVVDRIYEIFGVQR